MIKTFYTPFAETFYIGFNQKSVKSISSFIQRTKTSEHDSVKPHDDKSTLVFYVALNEESVDFGDGGIRFIRYNCTANNLRKGWALVFPSVITHYYENVDVSQGVRYSLISQIDA